MTGWSDEARVAQLKELAAQGLSAARIAAVLGGGLSRCAVIGKMHRLGLVGHGAGVSVRRVPRDRVVAVMPKAQKVAICAADHPAPLRLENGARITTRDLETAHCRWPHGDVGHPDFHYCGHAKVEGSPWCEFHQVRATEKAHPPSPERGSLGRAIEGRLAKAFGARP